MSTHSLRRCNVIGCIAVAVVALSCGQTVQPTEPTWIPPPGQTLSPLVGYWYANCRTSPEEIFVDVYNQRGRGEGDLHISSLFQFLQVGENEFRLHHYAGSVPDQQQPRNYTLYGMLNNFEFQPSQYSITNGAMYSIIDGSGHLDGDTIIIRWHNRVVEPLFPRRDGVSSDVLFLWQCTALRALDL